MNNTRKIVRIRMLGFLSSIALLSMACSISPLLSPRSSSVPTPVVVQQNPISVDLSSLKNEEDLLVDLYSRVNPSVVNITVYASQGTEIIPLGQASGFVFDDQRHLITNAHVVQSAEQIDVVFSDGSISSANVVGLDLNSDLAVIQVDELPVGVFPLPLGDMSELAVGQTVLAVGNPFGLEGTLTQGIISGLGRTIQALNHYGIPESIQTDAAINPGNSGGPLLNLDGEVIGVNAQIETGGTSRTNSGVGFAIPVGLVKRVIPELIEKGKAEWAWLGVSGGDVTPSLIQAMELPVERGAYIFEVVPGGPADQAGIRGVSEITSVQGRSVGIGGDVVTAVDGRPVSSFDDLLIYIAYETRPGQEIQLTLVRGSETLQVSLVLGSRPDDLASQ